MKANEVPEKVYLHLTTGNHLLNGKYYERKPAKIRNNDKIIEYTRTDTFIEKVCNLLSRMVWEVTYEDLEGDSVEHYDKTEFIEEIRKYLESKL